MTDKTNHVYEDTFQVDIKYTYDRKHNKVYDIDSAVREFNMLIKKLMKKLIKSDPAILGFGILLQIVKKRLLFQGLLIVMMCNIIHNVFLRSIKL